MVAEPARNVDGTPAASFPHPLRIAVSPTRASRLSSSGTGARPMSPDPSTTFNNGTGYTLGWTFTVGANNLFVTALGYFDNNKERMLYGTFREKGYFIGSGVVEAGCKTVIGQRVKESGMFWSVTGADNVLALRCAVMNGNFDGYWDQPGSFLAPLKEAA